MCTSFLDSLDGAARHVTERMSVAACARSPIARVATFGASRGWRHLRLISSAGDTCPRDYLAEDDQGRQWPMANVFVRRNGLVHHFWGSEMFHPCVTGNSRHVDQLWPLWNVLDLPPEGRGTDWYPAQQYAPGPAMSAPPARG